VKALLIFPAVFHTQGLTLILVSILVEWLDSGRTLRFITDHRSQFTNSGAGLLRHPDKMLTVASFRTWRGSHLPAAQGQPLAMENSLKIADKDLFG